MKSSRFQFKYRENASKLHKAVGSLLRNSLSLGFQEIYQEYPVSKINTKYENNRHHFDWVIPKLKLVFECHGKQHYQCITFGGETEDALENFNKLKQRDKMKKDAALNAGFVYVEIPFTLEKTINDTKLLELIEVGKEELKRYTEDRVFEEANDTETMDEMFKQKQKNFAREVRQRYLSSDKHMETLEKAREYRKEQYAKRKKLKNKL